MEDAVMDESLESVQWGHGQCMSKMDRMIAALGAEELERQQRSAGGSMASEAPRDTALLQEQDKEKESLRKLHERSPRLPSSVPEEMSMKRREDIAWAFTALQQGPAITEIATDDALLATLRSLLRAAEAEALRQTRVEAQIDRDRIERERQRAQELAIKNQELTMKNEELTIKNQELTIKNEELTIKNEDQERRG
ncbi:hypothetical protein KC343_g1240 [Hortaea werneckii]|nr:hypothetical protein KC352_g6349 [Hortaea werneckii]KAI7571713.1 hypothetical protein KC317_g1400 [Hortaea werneckii]KAI7626613.1 hypothetical protein KC346_g1171 [Hortaea werneckii]KAI7636537.1 hypothetical protein KC343_g1240 [Hortaea werneckii]KAI7682166.1 hypothetical protein KC319_g1162 [Hortaea werneckii]